MRRTALALAAALTATAAQAQTTNQEAMDWLQSAADDGQDRAHRTAARR